MDHQTSEALFKILIFFYMQSKMTKTSISSTDHDLLIELKTEFRDFVRTYSQDMKGLQDGVTSTLSEHKLRIDEHEKKLDEINRIIAVVKPEKTLEEYVAFKLRVENFFTTANAYRVAAGVIGGIITFTLTQVPNMLKAWGIIK